MRPSALRHPIAVLRTLLGYGQKDFAEFVGCSAATIQSVELGPQRMELSEELAIKIVLATGVSLNWLTAGDPAAPIFDKHGKPYTVETFRAYQERRDNLSPDDVTASEFIDFTLMVAQIFQTMGNARPTHSAYLAVFQMQQALRPIFEQYGVSGANVSEATPILLDNAIDRLEFTKVFLESYLAKGLHAYDDGTPTSKDHLTQVFLNTIEAIDEEEFKLPVERPLPKPQQKVKAANTARRPSVSPAPGKKRKAD